MSVRNSSAEPLRVCIVNEFFYPDSTGGTGSVLTDLAMALRQSHPDVSIDVITSRNLYRDPTASLEKEEIWNGLRISRIGTPHPGNRSTISRLAVNSAFSFLVLRTLLTRRRYDVILIGTAPPTLAMAAHALKRLTGTPFLYVIYDLDPDRAVNMGVISESNPVARLLRAAQRSWLHASDKTVVLGRCMQQYLARVYGLPESKSVVIPIGADTDAIVPGAKQNAFRLQNELSGFVISYSGNFGRYHNFDTILDAAKELAKIDQSITFVLSGNGAQRPHVERRVETEGITNVRLCPFVPKEIYSEALAAADVSLVTLEPGMEGLCVPSKFYSILASGRPVIALVSPISEVARVIEEEECGIQVDHGDVIGLVNAISSLAAHRETADRMGENSRQAAVSKYTTRHSADLYYHALRPNTMATIERELVP